MSFYSNLQDEQNELNMSHYIVTFGLSLDDWFRPLIQWSNLKYVELKISIITKINCCTMVCLQNVPN